MPPRNSHTPLDPITMQRSTRRTLGATSSQGPEQHSRAGLGRTGGRAQRGGSSPERTHTRLQQQRTSRAAVFLHSCKYTFSLNLPATQLGTRARNRKGIQGLARQPKVWGAMLLQQYGNAGQRPICVCEVLPHDPPPLRTQYRWIV